MNKDSNLKFYITTLFKKIFKKKRRIIKKDKKANNNTNKKKQTNNRTNNLLIKKKSMSDFQNITNTISLPQENGGEGHRRSYSNSAVLNSTYHSLSRDANANSHRNSTTTTNHTTNDHDDDDNHHNASHSPYNSYDNSSANITYVANIPSFNNNQNTINSQIFHAPTMTPVHNLSPNVPLPRFHSGRRPSYPFAIIGGSSYNSTNFPAPITPFNTPTPVSTALSQNRHIDNKNGLDPKLIIFMVGLPARGKSYICQKLRRYLAWIGYKTRIFNVGNKRRVAALHYEQTNVPGTKHDANFFDPANAQHSSERDLLAQETLQELISWLKRGGNVGIHDATNSTKKRRQMLLNMCKKEPNIITMFVESICTDQKVIEHNVSMKLRSPDYINMDPVKAISDFKARMSNYEKAYETVSEDIEGEDISYIKSVNVGRKVTGYNIHGYLCSQCVFYLMNIHIKERTIWLTRHGESVYNLCNRIGGDSPLTEFGRRYSQSLARFIQQFHPPDKCSSIIPENDYSKDGYGPLSIWTSNLRRSKETTKYFDPRFNIKSVRFLNEIYSGSYENMTMEEIQQTNPEDFAARQANKLLYRYPGAGGESYMDVIDRLRPGIIELERLETSVLIVTHNVVMRTLLAYFTGIDLQEMPSLNIPLHTLYCLKPKPYGAELLKYRYNSMTDSFDHVE